MDSEEVAIIETVIKKVILPIYGQEALGVALSLWENQFKSSNKRFSWRVFCTTFSRDFLDTKSNNLYHSIVRENVAVRMGKESNEKLSISGIDTGTTILANVWSIFFREIASHCSDQDRSTVFQYWPDEIRKSMRNARFDAVGWLNAIASGNVATAQQAALDKLEFKKLSGVLYNLACEDFNPVIVDKVISKAIEKVESMPCASGISVRKVLF